MTLKVFEKIYMGAATPKAIVPVGGNIVSVNGEEPDENGNVVVTGANINATVSGTTDSVTDHLSTIKNDLDDLGDQVSVIEGKIPEAASSANQMATASDITGITEKIPSGASSSNKLATASDISSITAKIPDAASAENKMATASDITGITAKIPDNATAENKMATASDIANFLDKTDINEQEIAGNLSLSADLEVMGDTIFSTANPTCGSSTPYASLVDGEIPTKGQIEQVIIDVVSSIPTATASNKNKIVLFNGTTTSDYTNGYIYKNIETLERLDVAQTEGTSVGDITTDIDVFKAKAGTEELTYIFDCLGAVTSFKAEDSSHNEYTLTRDAQHDTQTAYAWLDGDEVSYFTAKTNIKVGTSVYEMPSDPNPTLTVTEIVSRATTGIGYWFLGSLPDPVNMAEYGIYFEGVGMPGAEITAEYTATSYAFTRIDVQPLDLTAVSGYDATKTQTLKNTSGVISWVDDA